MRAPSYEQKQEHAIAQTERREKLEKKLTNADAFRGKWHQYAKARKRDYDATKKG